MRTFYTLLYCMAIVFPLSVFAQRPANPANINCHAAFVADTLEGCAPFRVRFTDQSVPPVNDPVIRWQWSFGDGKVSTEANPTHVYTSPGYYTVKLVVSTQLGWTDSLKQINYIKVFTSPEARLGNDTTICQGSVLPLQTGTPNAVFLWSTGETTQKIWVTDAGEYWVRVTLGSCVATDTIRVYTKPELLPRFGADIRGYCLPVDVKFTDSTQYCGDHKPVRWVWDFGDGQSSTQKDPLHTYSTADTFIVRMTVYDATGLSMTRSRRVVITGHARPVVNLGPDTTICENDNYILNAGNAGAVYLWNDGSTAQSLTVSQTGPYWVAVNYSGCVVADTVQVKVKPALMPQFGYRKEGICLPVTAHFTDSSVTCGVQIVRWAWDFGDGSVASVKNPSHAYTDTGEYIVRLTVTDHTGNSMTRSKRLRIDASTLAVNLGADLTVCWGEVATLNAGLPGVQYLWSTGETTGSIQVQDEGAYWVQVMTGNCTARDTVEVKSVFPLTPGFEFEVKGKCLPVAVKFMDKTQVRCEQKIVRWSWDFGDGSSSSEASPEHIYTAADTFAVRLTVTTDKGVSISKSRQVIIVNTIPVISAGSDITICPGSRVQLDAGIDNAQYQWTPAESLDRSDIRKPWASPSASTLYKVSVTQCQVTVSDEVWVNIETPVKPQVLRVEEKLRTGIGTAYQWFLNGKAIAGAQRREYEPREAGYYTVKVASRLGCFTESDPLFFLPGKYGKWLHGIRIKCSPNPGNGWVRVLLSRLPEKPIQLTVIDRFGQRLYSTRVVDHNTLLNLTQLAKGQYFIELILDKERVTLPFLIQ